MIKKLKSHIGKEVEIINLTPYLNGKIGILLRYHGKNYAAIELEKTLICKRKRLKRIF